MIDALQKAFARLQEREAGTGASVCLWQGGRELCTLCTGESRPGSPWGRDTLVPIYSATKPASAACLLLALYDCCQGPELEVGELWPAFPAPHCTIGELLSHQSGLAAWDTSAPQGDLEACRAAIEKSTPLWGPPQHGYHPHTFGPMLDILMQELTGQRIGSYWEERVRGPLGLDFYIGLPPSEYGRVAPLHAPKLRGPLPDTPFYRAFFNPASPVYRAFHSVLGPDSAAEMSTPEAWAMACPAKGGVASARGLAAFYQALLGLLPGSPFPTEVTDWLRTPMCSGPDATLAEPTGFTCGAMYEPAELFGRGGFGHAGAGGCHAFCEPSSGLSFAFTMNDMEIGILPGERVRRLVRALRGDDAEKGCPAAPVVLQ